MLTARCPQNAHGGRFNTTRYAFDLQVGELDRGLPVTKPSCESSRFPSTCSSARLGVWSAAAWVFTAPGVQSVYTARV